MRRAWQVVVSAVSAVMVLAATTALAGFIGVCAGCMAGMCWGAWEVDRVKATGGQPENGTMLNPVGHLGAAGFWAGVGTGPLWFVLRARREARRAAAMGPVAASQNAEKGTPADGGDR